MLHVVSMLVIMFAGESGMVNKPFGALSEQVPFLRRLGHNTRKSGLSDPWWCRKPRGILLTSRSMTLAIVCQPVAVTLAVNLISDLCIIYSDGAN